MEWKEETPKCPACGAISAAKALECAVCGVVFAKWLKKAMREEVPSGRSLDEPPPLVEREADATHALALKGVGLVMLLLAVSLAGWLVSGGSSRAPVAGTVFGMVNEYSMSIPAGWSDKVESGCGGLWGACAVRLLTRSEIRPDAFPEWLRVSVIPRGPSALSASGRTELEEKFMGEIRGGMDEGALAPISKMKFDGIEGLRYEGRGKKHFKIETAAAVVTNSRSALAEQQRLNPNQGIYTVMGTYNPRSLNAAVTLKEAEYAVFDAHPVIGRIVVPMRSSILLLSYQYDEPGEASFTIGLDEALASLRVLKRARPMDGFGGSSLMILICAVTWLAYTGQKLLRA